MEDYFDAKASLFTPERARRGRGLRRRRVGPPARRALPASRSRRIGTAAADADWRVRASTRRRPGGVPTSPAPGGRTLHLRSSAARATSTSPTPRWPRPPWCCSARLPRAVRPRRCSPTPHVPGRMERVPAPDGGPTRRRAVVDYAHTPEAVRAALRGAAPDDAGPPGRRHSVPAATATATSATRWAPPPPRCADVVVVTDDNPRSEDPAAIRAAVLAGRRRRSRAGGRDLEVLEVGDRARRHRARPSTPSGPGRGRHGRRRRQGPRERPGGRRRRAPVRRPGRAGRRRSAVRPGRAPRDRAVARRDRRRSPAASVVGATRRRRRRGRRRRAGRHRLARGRPGRPVRRPRRRARRRARLRRRRRRRAARSRRWSTRPVEGVPCVVVADVQDAFAALAREVVSTACRDLTVVGITGSSGKTSTKDLLGPGAGRARADRRPDGLATTPRSACRSPSCRVTADTRYLVVEMGARGIGHIAYLTRIAPPDGRRGAQRRHRARRRVRLARGDRHGQGRAGRRRCRRDGLAVLNADDPRGARRWPPLTDARVVLVGEADDADVRADDVALDAAGRAVVHRWHGAAGQARRSGCGCTASTTSATRSRSRRSALELGMPLEQVAPALESRATGQPLADGGHRARRRRDRRQRRLQRQPRLDAGRAHGARARWAAGAAPGPCSARCSSSGDESDAQHAEVGAAGRRASASTRLVVVGEGAAALAAAARAAGTASWRARQPACRCRTPTRPTALLDARARAPATSCWSSRAVTPGCGCSVTDWPRPREELHVKAVLIAAVVSLVISLFGTPLFIRFLVAARLRPVHPRRRPDLAPHQARHADDGRRRHHRRPRSSAYVVAHLVTLHAADRDRRARAVPDDRAGPGRLPRRLHQDLQAAQPGPAQPARSWPARRWWR